MKYKPENFDLNFNKIIPVDEFIEKILYHREFGYYTKKIPFGKKGDFITAPTISNLFSEIVTIWLISCWEKFGKPKKFNFVELGPGDGSQSGWTPLHVAVMNGQLDIIKLLLEYGASINETDDTQNTPLDYIWVPQNMISNFELFGVSTEEMDLPYTKESLNEVKQFLLESGAIHGNGTMSELAQMESTNVLDQLSESLDQNDSDISYLTPSWSPDGSKIVFSSDMHGQWGSNIYVMDSDGTNITRLTKQDSSDMSPSWSPDGSKIAFISDMHGQMFTNIYVMDSDGTNITRLTTKRNCWDEFPSWSPDGEKILFESCQYEGTEFRETIFVMDSDGTNMTMLIAWEDAGEDEFPYWSPDGSKIVFSSNLDGQLYGTKNNEMLGFIKGLSYAVEAAAPFETEAGKRVPMYVNATLGYQIIHAKTPSLDTQFYGYIGDDQMADPQNVSERLRGGEDV